MTELSLAGRVALVTGSASGIGRAIALELAARGAVVAVNDLREDRVSAVVEEIAAGGGHAMAVPQDIASRDGMRAAIEAVAGARGHLDILVNNAAWVRYQGVPAIQPETVDRMVDISFKAVIWGIQSAAEVMRPERRGTIINIASVEAFRSTPGSMVYSGIKAGLLGLTRAAAAELGPSGIRVNAICPGPVPTEGTMRLRNADRDAARVAQTPLGRLGTVKDVARATCFLAGEDAQFITGQALLVDGGMTFADLRGA
ncbi:glucose 1-dehydrogenase [Paralimibaculum aggregatum]|uniref:Glucose 1-dehydrogenase n=1 Tax=Paralimibaculum aggregatum TaxID=3036245 RepID=A0ABQ6LKA6_9RHOB|nr:SDR family oxidoreductase [Limibaculum sp. NKW23]GMG82102.1 glucose 1-dehydrogenase [Limibaculum sp. NKW23]